MKHSHWMLSLVVGMLLLAACGVTTLPTPAAAPTQAPAGSKTLGLVLSTLNNPFFVTLRDGAQHAADEANVKLIVIDAQDDSAKMMPASRT